MQITDRSREFMITSIRTLRLQSQELNKTRSYKLTALQQLIQNHADSDSLTEWTTFRATEWATESRERRWPSTRHTEIRTKILRLPGLLPLSRYFSRFYRILTFGLISVSRVEVRLLLVDSVAQAEGSSLLFGGLFYSLSERGSQGRSAVAVNGMFVGVIFICEISLLFDLPHC